MRTKPIHLKALLIIASILGMLLPLHAQDWTLDFGDSDSYSFLGYGGTVSINGDVIVVGIHGNSMYDFHPMAMRISPDGDTISRQYEELYMVELFSVVQLNNGNYLTSGVLIDTSVMFRGGYQLMVMVLDSNLNLINHHAYEHDSIGTFFWGLVPNRMLLDDDGTVIVSGAYYYPHPSFNPEYPYFYRLDENGAVLNHRFVYKTDSSNPEYYIRAYQCHNIIKNPHDGSLIVLARIRGGAGFLFYDSDFNYIRDFTFLVDGVYPNLGLFFESSCDTWLSEDRLLVMGTINENMWWDTIPFLHTGLADISLDGTLNRVKQVCHRPDTNDVVRKMMRVNDSTIYGLLSSWEYFTGPYASTVFLFNTDMEVLGMKVFKEQGNYKAAQGFPLADGGCMFISHEFEGYSGRGRIIRLTRESFSPLLSVEEVPKESMKARAFPNPARDVIKINIGAVPQEANAHVRVCDAIGRTCIDRSIRNKGNLLTLGVSVLNAGLYTYTIYNDNQIFMTGKFIKE